MRELSNDVDVPLNCFVFVRSGVCFGLGFLLWAWCSVGGCCRSWSFAFVSCDLYLAKRVREHTRARCSFVLLLRVVAELRQVAEVIDSRGAS